MAMNKKISKILFLLTTLVMLISFSMVEKASAASIYYSNNTTTHGGGSTNMFYTDDGEFTVKVNVLSIKDNKNNNGLKVNILKPALIGYNYIATEAFTTTGKGSFKVDGGKAGYYKIELGLSGFTGWHTPIEISSIVEIID